jgi:LmbE family N-acetylglucosaminyl deacetylase
MANVGNELTDPKYNPIVLYVAPHPDDEIWAGGYIFECIKKGCEVFVLLITHGSGGYSSPDQRDEIEDIRFKEMVQSQKILGFKLVNFYDYLSELDYSPENATAIDGKINPMNLYLKNGLVKVIRKIRPTTVLIPNKNDAHPDHRNAAEAVIDAIWRSERNFQLELGKPHTVPRVFQYEITNLLEDPTHLIDITGEPWENVKKTMAVHKSQIERDLGYQLVLNARTLIRGLGISGHLEINEILNEDKENKTDSDKAITNYIASKKAKRAEALKATPLRKFW